MASQSSEFTLPESRDRVVIAIQDILDQFKWPIIELSDTLIVARAKDGPFADYLFPKVSLSLKDGDESGTTAVGISVSYPGLNWGTKSSFSGIIGRVTNSLSLRVQAQSIAINPTVAMGQGQGREDDPVFVSSSRAQQLKDLKDLLDAGVLTPEEFAAEKERVLRS